MTGTVPSRGDDRALAVLGRDLLVVVGLWGLAVAQPLLDLFGRNPEFFVAKDASTRDVVLLGLAITFVPPALIAIVEAVALAVARPVGRAVHSGFVGVLGAALGLNLARQLGVDVTVLAVVAGLAAGVGLAVGERRREGMRLALRLLALAPVLFLANYLLLSSSSRLIWESEAQVATNVEVGRQAPVVEIVFDEFPLASILDADGTINAARFPNFARLAAASNWYRNGTSVSWQTEHSVPSILTGKMPEDGEIATSIDHPRNLFTLLGGSYEMNVVEQITDLCPSGLCAPAAAAPPPSAVSTLRSSLEDAVVVYGHATLPSALRDHLPSIGHSWGGFVEGDGPADAAPVETPAEPAIDAPAADPGSSNGSDATEGSDGYAAFARWAELGIDGQSPPAQGAVVEDLIDSASTPGDSRLSFAHVVLPHFPWQMTPSGRRYTSRSDLASFTERSAWPDDATAVRQAQQQHLYQVGYADTLIGGLIDRMEAAGTWDEALVVVVADHGLSFLPGGPQRSPTRDNADEIYRVPFFVKVPGQAQGVERDDDARLVDVLPTMADALRLETDWEFDGRSLVGPGPAQGGAEADSRGRVPGDIGPFSRRVSAADGLAVVTARNDRWFGLDPGWRGVVGVGRWGATVGERVEDLVAGQATGIEWTVDEEDALGAVDLASGFVPVVVSGQLEAAAGEAVPASVLVAVNGVVAGVSGDLLASGGRYHFKAVLDETVIRDGLNTVQVLVPRGNGPQAGYRLAVPADRMTYALEGADLVPNGPGSERIEVDDPTDDRRLEVESAFADGQTLAIKGWSVDRAEGVLPDTVLVFADGRQVGVAGPRPRADLEPFLGPTLLESGFEAVVAADRLADASEIRVVAVYGDRAVGSDVEP